MACATSTLVYGGYSTIKLLVVCLLTQPSLTAGTKSQKIPVSQMVRTDPRNPSGRLHTYWHGQSSNLEKKFDLVSVRYGLCQQAINCSPFSYSLFCSVIFVFPEPEIIYVHYASSCEEFGVYITLVQLEVLEIHLFITLVAKIQTIHLKM